MLCRGHIAAFVHGLAISAQGTLRSTTLSYAVWHIRPTPLRGRLCDLPGDAVRQYVILVINGVSLLETELGNGQPHHVLVINFQAPPGQQIEHGHRPRHAGAEVGPHAMPY